MLSDRVNPSRKVLLIYHSLGKEGDPGWRGSSRGPGRMGVMLRAALLLSSLLQCSAFLELSGSSEIKGVWKDSITLPCAYAPVEDLVQQTLTWTVVHDKGSGTILRRDSSGDHILLSEYRDRVSIPKDVPGNVSLLILSLEISDRGTYTCHVTWRDSNNSLIAKAITTSLEVVKVAATKPIIRAEPGLTLPAGASASLTCEASGSPPISYRWFRSSPAATAQLLSSGAELAWSSLRPSDSGSYFCEAENRAGAGAVQRSDAVQLTVTDLPTTTATLQRSVGTTWGHHSTIGGDLPTTTATLQRSVGTTRGHHSTIGGELPIAATTSESGVEHPGKNETISDSQRTGLPLYLVVLIAVVCGAVVFLVISLIMCVRKPKDAQVYDVKFHNSRAAASSNTHHYEEPICSTENNYVMVLGESKTSEEVNKNASDSVATPQESEYEVGDTS